MISEYDLSGKWKAVPLNDKVFSWDDLEKIKGWVAAPVPGQWQRDIPGLESHWGRVVYVSRFRRPPDPGNVILSISGIFSYGEIWLNGKLLGDHEGYFCQFTADVTPLIGDENTLVVAVECWKEGKRKDQFHGIFSDYRLYGRCQGGILIPPKVVVAERLWVEEISPKVVSYSSANKIAKIRVDVTLYWFSEPAELSFDAVVVPVAVGSYSVSEGYGEKFVDLGRCRVKRGKNKISLEGVVVDPLLWHPVSSCKPSYFYEGHFHIKEKRAVIYELPVRFGVRKAAVDQGRIWVNDKEVFIRGINYVPPVRFLMDYTSDTVLRDILAMEEVGANAIRLMGFVAPERFYSIADEKGILIWQDAPIYGRQSRGTMAEAKRQARVLAKKLGQHPSVVVVGCCVDPWGEDIKRKNGVAYFLSSMPNWEKIRLSKAVAAEVRRELPTTIVIRHTGTPGLKSTAVHSYIGWYGEGLWKVKQFLLSRFMAGRVIGEFGAKAIPSWEVLKDLPKSLIEKLINDLDGDPLKGVKGSNMELVSKESQIYQAFLIKYWFEHMRLFLDTGIWGGFLFTLADPPDTAGFGVLDFKGHPKKAFSILRVVFQPLLPILDRQPLTCRVGNSETAKIYLSNVSHLRYSRVYMIWQVKGPSFRDAGEWQGSVGPMSLVETSTVRIEFSEEGRWVVNIKVFAGDNVFSNHYAWDIERGGDEG